METQNKRLGGYAVEIDLIHTMAGCVVTMTVRARAYKQNVDGLFVQRSDVKSVKCGENVPQLACETA